MMTLTWWICADTAKDENCEDPARQSTFAHSDSLSCCVTGYWFTYLEQEMELKKDRKFMLDEVKLIIKYTTRNPFANFSLKYLLTL